LLLLSPLDAAYSKRKKITIDPNQVSGTGNLTDFPVLINISSDTDLRTTGNGGDVTDAQGDDIIFRDSGGAQLDHEVEKYTPTTGQYIAWVRIPTLSGSANTVIYIYYGNSSVTTSQEDIDGVWEANYVGVWHLDEGGTGTRADSSGTGNNGTPTNYDGDEATSSGRIDGADDFDGTNDYISVAHHATLAPTDRITVECWAKSDDSLSQYDALVLKTQDTTYNYGYGFQFNNSTTIYFHVNGFWDDAAAASVTASNWNHYVGLYDGSNVRIFVNGTEGTANAYTGSIDTTTNDLQIGRARIDTKCFPGIIDEVRVSNTNRSSDWIKTCYNNQSNPSTFYSVGSEEDGACAFAYRKAITIDADYVSGTSGSLTDFPVLINISSDNDLRTYANGGHVLDSNGYDIIFRDSSQGQLDHEIEKYTATTGELIAWVRVPTLSKSSNTTIYMVYGNCDIATSKEDVPGVWSSYRAVWHLEEDQAGTGNADLYQDSTSGDNDGDDYISATGKTGKISSGQQFDGSDDYAQMPNDLFESDSTGAIMAWVKVDGTATYQAIYTSSVTSASNMLTFSLIHSGSNDNRLYIQHYLGVTLNNCTRGNTTFNDSTWTHVAVTTNGSTWRLYVNGSEVSSYTQLVGSNTGQWFDDFGAGTHTVRLGREQYETAQQYYLAGYLDEASVSGTTFDADWIATCYNNQSSPGTFYSVSGETGPSFPTAVTLISFTATGGEDGVVIRWETGQELDTLGFHIFRSTGPDGPWIQITENLVPGHLSSLLSQRYEYADPDVERGALYYYWLEEIDIHGSRTLYGPVGVDWDADGVPDDEETIPFVRGDVSADGRVDLGDMIQRLRYHVGAGPEPPCLKAADLNDDGGIDLGDAIYGFLYLFAGGREPPPPMPGCGADPTRDALDCRAYPACP